MFEILPWFTIALTVGGLIALLFLVRHIQRKNRTQPDRPELWENRAYRCPQCGRDLAQGWVLLGKGAIWSPRAQGKPGLLSHIGSALPNTLSLAFPPAANMAWHCSSCQILVIDHSRLVR